VTASVRRRFVLAAGLVAVAPWLRVQGQERRYRIGILHSSKREISVPLAEEPFLGGLAAAGYVEGRNLEVERRSADGMIERLPALARELVGANPDLIVSPSSPATAALKATGTTIPVVFCFVTDPIAAGFAESLSRPGRNFTGLSNFSAVVAGKRIELLGELIPKLSRLSIWYNPDAVNDGIELEDAKRAAARLGIQLRMTPARSPAEFESAAAATRKSGADAIYVMGNPASLAFRKEIVGLIAGLRLPAIYSNSVFADVGGLIAYAPNFPDLARRAAAYADRILRGAKPGDLPIEQPTKIDLVINLRAAKAIGVSVPQSLVFRADRVIE